MKAHIKKLISHFTFRRKYGLLSKTRYEQFVCFIAEKIAQSIDKETELLSLSIENTWHDQGGNTHTSLRGKITRRNEEADIGAEIVWLKRLKTFRGSFWSQLKLKSDKELFSEAKLLFHAGKYAEFLALANYIEAFYSSNPVFIKMYSIARNRV